MKIIVSISFLVLGLLSVFGQISHVAEKFPLPPGLNESSGAIFFNGKLIIHNDSGGENKLYELDTISGQVTRTVIISNATNVDWEDITQDENSIYIADIGNNNGNRTDLKVYKISKSDYTASTNITAETIAYSYSDQTNFTSTPNSTKWDAEALVSFDDNNLIVFTKNWVDGITKGYLIPKTPGTHVVNPLAASLDGGGLITGGTFNPLTRKLYLVGYTQIVFPFVWECHHFNDDDVFSGINTRTPLSALGNEQAEAIAFVGPNRYLVTSESFSISFGPFTVSDYAKLISFSTNDSTLSMDSIENIEHVVLYPNPVMDVLKVKSLDMISVEIFDTKLMQLYKGNETDIDVSRFGRGIYIVKIHLRSNDILIKKVIKK